MSNPNNPLRQYFRRPALSIGLPSKGKFYPDNALDMPVTGELPVYPMTAIDEITSKTPDALFNGSAIVDIIKSCIPAIKDPWQMPSSDLDTVLVGIRAATSGNTMDIESECPSCEETSKYGINIVALLSGLSASGYDKPLQIGELFINFRPLSYLEVNQSNMAQFEIQREIANVQAIDNDDDRLKESNNTMKKLTAMNIQMVAESIASISVPGSDVTDREYIREYLEGCDKNAFENIRSHAIKLRESSNVKPIKIKCVNCSHEYEQPLALNATDFFG